MTNRASHHGFTLMEILVVLFLCVAILVPAYNVFRSGSQTSMKGMKRIDLVLEARRVLRMIHDDLKQSCIIFQEGAPKSAIDNMFTAMNAPSTSYSFNSFPRHIEQEKIISARISDGEAPRFASKITYRLEPSDNPKLAPYQLIREEKFPPDLAQQEQKKVLSQRVAIFSIRPVPLQAQAGEANKQYVFVVTLQLCELPPTANISQTQSGEIVSNNTTGVVIADFFDLVFPTQFNARMNYQYEAVNWYNPLVGP